MVKKTKVAPNSTPEDVAADLERELSRDEHFPHEGPCDEYPVRDDWELCVPAMLDQMDSLKARMRDAAVALRSAEERSAVAVRNENEVGERLKREYNSYVIQISTHRQRAEAAESRLEALNDKVLSAYAVLRDEADVVAAAIRVSVMLHELLEEGK